MDYSGMLSKAKKKLKSASLRAKSKKARSLASLRVKNKPKNETYKTSSASDMKKLGSMSSYLKALTSSKKDRSPASTRKPDSITPKQKADFKKRTAVTNKSIDSTMKKHFFQNIKNDLAKKAKKSKSGL